MERFNIFQKENPRIINLKQQKQNKYNNILVIKSKKEWIKNQ